MCGRFTITKPSEIKKRFSTQNKSSLFEPSWNIAPSQVVPVITRNSPNKVTMMRWGLLFSKNSFTGTINIRSETTKEKPFFKGFLQNKRCIVPADGFYEWGYVNLEGKEEKYPFYFYLKDRKMFAFAGIYNDFEDAEGKPYYSFCILTCPPNKLVGKIHNRMPCILKSEDENEWLRPENKDFEKLITMLRPYSERDMKINLVSKRVNNPRNDSEALINPITAPQL